MPPALAGIVLGGAVMGLTMAPAAALDVTDPRSWNGSDWISDVVPHLAYGWATAATFDAGSDRRRSGEERGRRTCIRLR